MTAGYFHFRDFRSVQLEGADLLDHGQHRRPGQGDSDQDTHQEEEQATLLHGDGEVPRVLPKVHESPPERRERQEVLLAVLRRKVHEASCWLA